MVDIRTMEFFLRCADFIFPEFKLMWLVEETKKNLPKELDFLQEARNAEKLRGLFKHVNFLHVPEIYFDLTSEKVLTMEFCEGAQISDLQFFKDNNIDTHDLARKLGKIYSLMIFKYGFIHADPHPGNLLIQKLDNGETRIILIDHGLYSVSSLSEIYSNDC